MPDRLPSVAPEQTSASPSPGDPQQVTSCLHALEHAVEDAVEHAIEATERNLARRFGDGLVRALRSGLKGLGWRRRSGRHPAFGCTRC
ncbi:MAG: hypothetical protein U5L03_00295 [Burkholderiaceae bacterium]|nr:hypothetical protein [Burkholderiaceae bacterium]